LDLFFGFDFLAARFFGLSFIGLCGVFIALLSAASKRTFASFSENSSGVFAMSTLLSEFLGFPEERDLIGQMLIAYGEIEFKLTAVLSHALNSDLDLAAKVLFRVRGEGARIEVADALIRPAYYKIGLGPKWENALGALKVCKRIRNQYAHCHWQIWNGSLRFVDLDAEAQTTNETMAITFLEIDLPLLELQAEYFAYAIDWLHYLENEYEKRSGRKPKHEFDEPKSLPAPLPYIQKK
jgi:hypothetical protein